MRCPHCFKESKNKVIESRRIDGQVWRVRLCSLCFKTFVTEEKTSAELQFPWKKLEETKSRHKNQEDKTSQLKGDAKHLQSIWK